MLYVGLLQVVLFTVRRYIGLIECVWFCNKTPDLYRETVMQHTLRKPSGLARMAFKSSSVINLVYSYMASQTRFEYSLLFEWCYYRGLFIAISLPPSADSAYMIYQHLISRWKANKTSWSNPRQTPWNTDLLYFSAQSYYKCSVEKNFPYICYRISALGL